MNVVFRPTPAMKTVGHRVALLVIVGSAPYPELASAFVATLPHIEAFLGRHEPPFVGKVFRPSPGELERNPSAAGRVELWYPR